VKAKSELLKVFTGRYQLLLK